MKKLSFCVLLVALLAVGCATTVKQRNLQATPAQLSSKEATEVDEKTDVECRWIVPTGSSLRKRVCKSRFEWEMEKQSAQDFLQRPRAGAQIGK